MSLNFFFQILNNFRINLTNFHLIKIKSFEEKPKNPNSNLAITGLYVFDRNFYDLAKKLKPSSRNELEIIDILKYYKNKRIVFVYFGVCQP